MYNLAILHWWEFSYESFLPSPKKTTSALPQESLEHSTSPALREISLSTWISFLCLRGYDMHIEARGLFMIQWDILETSVPVLTQEQDIQNKVNSKGQ